MPDGDRFEITVIQYISGVYDMKPEVFEQTLQAAKPDRWEALMGTVAEAWTKRAREEALLIGEAQGLAKGKAETLTRLLERRFGPLRRQTHDRIANAELDQIETWLDALLDAPDLNGVFAAGKRH